MPRLTYVWGDTPASDPVDLCLYAVCAIMLLDVQ